MLSGVACADVESSPESAAGFRSAGSTGDDASPTPVEPEPTPAWSSPFEALVGIEPLRSDVNVVKAAAFWLDKRHESAGEVANINLQLQQSVSGIWGNVVNDTDPDDNKAFVFKHYASGAPADPIRLRLTGVDVQGHDFGCGNDSIMVHVAMFAEDSDRESPTYDPNTGEGIAPEEI
jgi:hypothetical protein